MRSKGINKGKEPVFRNMECIVIDDALWHSEVAVALHSLKIHIWG